jgi:hypothetical protein
MKNTDSLKSWLEAIVRPGGAPSGAELSQALAELDRSWQEAGAEMDPHFKHYLEKRSYQKAYDWLKSQAEEHEAE